MRARECTKYTTQAKHKILSKCEQGECTKVHDPLQASPTQANDAGKSASKCRVLQDAQRGSVRLVLDRASIAARREICRDFARISLRRNRRSKMC